jgi:hypothetical protein
MNDDLRQVLHRLGQQGYRFDFDEQTPDHEVEDVLDLVFADYCDDLDLEGVCDCAARALPLYNCCSTA